MDLYKREFIDFMVQCGVLTFGDFVTKSGRRTPFFINTGNYRSGTQLVQLGHFYARALKASLGSGFDVLFGPAYKGIPLVALTAAKLADEFGQDVPFCFNRKEVKDHGEGGSLIGYKPQDGDRVVIVEDVTTAGTSVRETVPILKAVADVQVVGLLVSVDRQERGTTNQSALAELEQEFGLKPIPIVTLDEIVEYLHNREIDGRVILDDELLERINDYRKKYGARD